MMGGNEREQLAKHSISVSRKIQEKDCFILILFKYMGFQPSFIFISLFHLLTTNPGTFVEDWLEILNYF